MGDFGQWLLQEGVPEAHLAGYRRGAALVRAEAKGAPVLPKHVDMALANAERGGATGKQLANLKRIGDAYVRFEAPQRRPPAPNAQAAPRGDAPPMSTSPVAPVAAAGPGQAVPGLPAEDAANAGQGRCDVCGAGLVVGRGQFSVGAAGGGAGIVAMGVGFFFGLIGAFALISGLLSIGMAVAGLGTRLKCGSCGAAADYRLAGKGLVANLWKQRIGFAVGSVLLLGVTVMLGLFWLSLHVATAPGPGY